MNLLNKFEERPLDSIKDNLNKLIDMLTDLTNKTKNVLVRVQRLVMTLGEQCNDIFSYRTPELVQTR